MKTGTSTGAIETSKRYAKKQARRRRAEEKAWEEQNGTVLIRIGNREIYAKSAAKKDIAAAREYLLRAIAAGTPEGDVRAGS